MSSSASPATLLKRRTKALMDPLPAAGAGDPKALHRARIASRRLREVLPLLGAGKKARKRVRRLTELLGRVREIDVALELLDGCEPANPPPRLALYEARQHLQKAREARREQMLRQLGKLDISKLERRLEAAVEEVEEQDGAVLRRKLATRLGRRAVRLSASVREAAALYVPERLHAVRIAAKKLRYALEIAAEIGVKPAAKLAATVRRAQVMLGHLQDRTVLQHQLHEAIAATDDAAVRHGLLAMSAALDEECRELHGGFLALRDQVAEAAAGVRQQVVPDLAGGALRKPLRAGAAGARAARTGTARRLRTHG